MVTASTIKTELQKLENKATKTVLQKYFKTKKGEYGENDIFLGIKVGPQREIAKKYKDLLLKDIEELLRSRIHEHRLTALLILVNKFNVADETEKKAIFETYLKNRTGVNNWDLVDLSAPKIVGSYLIGNKRHVLYNLAKSENIWERRIAIISTFAFIQRNDFKDALAISEILLNDKHDLIQKAVGWMLREIGKRDISLEETFLKQYCKEMPRTMLRYAIEKFDDRKKKFYLRK